MNYQEEQPNEANKPIENYQKPLTFEKVWMMFQETDKMFKETDRQFKETYRQFKETDKQFKEAEKKMDKRSKETDRQFKETDKKFKETDKKIKELSNLFTSQWGRLIESLVEGSIVRLFQKENINVHYTQERVKGSSNGENFEFDIMAFNDNDMVVIEVKTTLRPDDVNEFLEKMKKIKLWMPRFKDYNTLAAVAYLKAHAGADRQAEKAGLYLIKATGDSAHIANQEGFLAKRF